MRQYVDARLGNGKPAPDVFLKAAELLGLEPGECLVIEDSYNGIRAANAAGCQVVMVPDMDEPTEETKGSLYTKHWSLCMM